MATNTKGGDGALSLEDGAIIMGGAASATPAVSTAGANLVFKDIWVQSPVAAEFANNGTLLQSTANTSKHIAEWWFGAAPASTIAFSNGLNVSAHAMLKGFPVLDLPSAPPSPAPTGAVLSLQHSWTRDLAQSLAWSANSSVMLDAVRDCGATPSWVNSTDDDGAAIQACLLRSNTVFVPRGTFLLWSPLVLQSGHRLIGAGKHCATLLMLPGSIFAAAPLLQIGGAGGGGGGAGGGGQAAVLSDLVLATAQRGTILSTKANTLVRDLRTTPCTTARHATGAPACLKRPTAAAGAAVVDTAGAAVAGTTAAAAAAAAGVRFEAGASGKIFGLCLDHFAAYLLVGDALLSAAGAMADGGVHLYQLSAEHLPTDYQIQVQAASRVHFHAFKFESAGFLAHPSWGPPGGGLFSCQSSSNISIFGGSGNYGIMNASLSSNIFFAENCSMQLSGLTRKPSPGETPASKGALWIESVASSGGAAVKIDDSAFSVLAFS